MKIHFRLVSWLQVLFTTLCLSCLGAITTPIAAADLQDETNHGIGTAISDGCVNAYEAFPDIIRSLDGEFLLVFYAGPNHIGPGGVIAMTRSTDQGLTWSKPHIICASKDCDNRDPSLFRTKTGTILCTTMTAYPGKGGPNDRSAPMVMEVRIIRSTDNGETWSEPVPIPSPFHKLTACSSPMIQLDNGDLLLPVYGRDTKDGYQSNEPGKRDRTAIIRSSDEGKTWGDPVFIDENPEKCNQEPSLCLLSSGRILCMMRDRGGVSWSDDHGKTWSPIKYLDRDLDCPYLYPVNDNIIVCGMRHRDHKPAITMIVSTDGGMSWGEQQQMSDGQGAYPSIQRVTDDTFIYVFYRDENGPSRIHRIYFKVADDGTIIRLSPDEFQAMNK